MNKKLSSSTGRLKSVVRVILKVTLKINVSPFVRTAAFTEYVLNQKNVNVKSAMGDQIVMSVSTFVLLLLFELLIMG